MGYGVRMMYDDPSALRHMNFFFSFSILVAERGAGDRVAVDRAGLLAKRHSCRVSEAAHEQCRLLEEKAGRTDSYQDVGRLAAPALQWGLFSSSSWCEDSRSGPARLRRRRERP
jgi:hypothetical protein